MNPTRQCPGTRICCPNPDCGGVLPYFSVHEGYGFFQCSRKVGEGFQRRTCSQHVLYYATHRLVVVVAITREQRQRFDSADFTISLEAMLAEIGEALTAESLPRAAAA